MFAKTQGGGFQQWDDVRVFLALLRGATLAEAGAKLELDTSTVSRRLTALEAGLGTKLFERGRSGLVATHAAERARAGAEAMESAQAQLLRDLSGVEMEIRGVVRLSAPPTLVDTFIAPALVKLRERHPGLSVELDASTRVLDLTRHEADLAVRSVAPRGADLLVTKLARARWVAAASPELARKLGRLKRWDAAPWITWDRDFASFGPTRWLASWVPRAEVALRTSHFISQLRAAESGLGLVMVPDSYLVAFALTPVKYVPALARSAAEWEVGDVWLVGHKAQRTVPRVSALWEFLVTEFSRRAPRG